MADDVVRGDAVRSRADEARRALHAARRRQPAAPIGGDPPPDPPPPAPADEPTHDTDAHVRALVIENQALRAENAELRDALRRLRDEADRTLGP